MPDALLKAFQVQRNHVKTRIIPRRRFSSTPWKIQPALNAARAKAEALWGSSSLIEKTIRLWVM